MGRTRQPLQPLDVEVVQQAFGVRQDGTLVRRECHVAALTHEAATFRGPDNRLMVRVYINGAIRRMSAGRVAWVLACGAFLGRARRAAGQDDQLLSMQPRLHSSRLRVNPSESSSNLTAGTRAVAATGTACCCA
jgi:hypothetical protein